MLMGTFPAASKPLSPSLPSITPSSLPVCFVLTSLYLLSSPEHSILLLLLSCNVTFHLSASVYFSTLPSLSLSRSFSLSSLMNGVAGL